MERHTRMFMYVFALLVPHLLLGVAGQVLVSHWQWKPDGAQPITVSVEPSSNPLPKWFNDLQTKKMGTTQFQPIQQGIPIGYVLHTEYPAGSTPVVGAPDQVSDSPVPPTVYQGTNSPNLPHWYQDLQNKEMWSDGQQNYRPPSTPIRPTHPLDENGSNEGSPNMCPRDVIHDQYRGQGYFYSWADRRTKYLHLTWAAAVQFCKARCLELVSIESKDEDAYLSSQVKNARQTDVWTSGRKCDFRGCEDPSLRPSDVYGWFWEGSRTQLPPTTDLFDTNWSDTGALGKPQPDNKEGLKGREHESCLAIRNNAYNDGIRWHDEPCSRRMPFICEQRSRHNFLGYTTPML